MKSKIRNNYIYQKTKQLHIEEHKELEHCTSCSQELILYEVNWNPSFKYCQNCKLFFNIFENE